MKLSCAFSILSIVASASAFTPTSTSNTRGNTALSMSGVTRNPNFAKLQGGYLFPEIGRRRNAYLEENPDMADRIISLGIGDTTQPIPEHILNGLVSSAKKLGTKEGYSGYGAEQGMGDLRAKIADKLYGGIIKDSEVFVSDGAKCDIMRVQQVFGPGVTTAVQVRYFLSCSHNLYIRLFYFYDLNCKMLSNCLKYVWMYNIFRILPTLFMLTLLS